MSVDPVKLLDDMFAAAVSAAMPTKDNMPMPKAFPGRTIVIGAGKAAASMAKVVEDNWQGHDITGLVITRYQHGLDLTKIKAVEAGHPVPDNAGEEAAREIMRMVSNLTEQDQVICLISGGGSSLLSLPADGVSLKSKQQVNKALLKSGANISEMNTVRKKLSAIKGGRLAVAAYPAKTVTYMISDVPGDDPSVIASGPTVPDETTVDDALAVIEKYNIQLPEDVAAFLKTDAAETPDVSHPAFALGRMHMIAKPQQSLEAAAKVANDAGIKSLILGDSIEGEAKEVAKVMAGMARQAVNFNQPMPIPCVLISGGETTVTVSSAEGDLGRGGRNAEFLLSLTHELAGAEVYAIAADTDGIDGTEDNAGAIMTPQSFLRALEAGLSTADYLKRHDAYNFFKQDRKSVV